VNADASPTGEPSERDSGGIEPNEYEPKPGPSALADAERIGILGDLHGDLGHTLIVAGAMSTRGVKVLLVLGDWGFIWPSFNWGNLLDKLSRRLARHDQTMYFVDGNHEWFPRLYELPISSDGIRWVRPNIGHLPRGYRSAVGGHRTLAALGGANSIDRHMRAEGLTWWPEESITDEDLASLGDESVDILVGHDAPLHVPTLDSILASTAHHWPADALTYAAAGRAQFHRGFMQVRPRLSLSGHYHRHADEQVTYGNGPSSFTTRIVVMDMAGPGRISHAILDVDTLDVQYLYRDGAPVVKLDAR